MASACSGESSACHEKIASPFASCQLAGGKLLGAIYQVNRPQPVQAAPVSDRMNLALAIRGAASAFHEGWRPRLDLEIRPGFANLSRSW
jgi:hypothetical protein